MKIAGLASLYGIRSRAITFILETLYLSKVIKRKRKRKRERIISRRFIKYEKRIY